jgi:hypothetical protein
MNTQSFAPSPNVVKGFHLDRLYAVWDELSKIQLFDGDCLVEPFEHFPGGTSKGVVEQWLESLNPRFKVADVLAGKRLVTLKTRNYLIPVYDRNSVQLCVGDVLVAQVCAGRYGQTAKVNAVVKNEIEPYGQVMTSLNSRPHGIYFDTSPCSGFDFGYREFNDFEHGHVTWVEVVQP